MGATRGGAGPAPGPVPGPSPSPALGIRGPHAHERTVGARPYFPALDGLRALGAIAVFVKHSSLTTGQQLRGGYAWMNHFEAGPALFFVLSAVLVYEPFARAHLTGQGRVDARRFAWRRIVRVVPAYWVALTVLLIFVRKDSATGFGIVGGGTHGVVELYSFTQIYDPRSFFHGIAAAYTLDVEMSFYVFVIAWALLLRRVARRASDVSARVRIELAGIAVLVVVNLAWRFAMLELRPANAVCDATHTHWTCAAANWLPGFLDYFAFGMLVAIAVAWLGTAAPGHAGAARLARIGARPWMFWTGAALAFWLYSARYGTTGLATLTGSRGEVRHELVGVIVALLVLPCVFGDQTAGLGRALLSSRPLRWFSAISYGFYLWHQGWIDQVMSWTGSLPFRATYLVVAPLAFVGATLTAVVSRHLVELPAQRGGGRRSARTRGGAGRRRVTEQAAPAARAAPARFVGLEGLRTIGVVAVLLTHTGFATGVTTSTRWGSLLGHLEIGPAIFFVISAFLLYRPFVSATLSGRAPPSTGRFLRRRAVRVFPAYWLTLAIFVVTSQVHLESGAQLVKLVTLTHIYTQHDFFAIDIWVPTWTLATELSFYVFLVLYAPAMRWLAARRPSVRSRLQVELLGALALVVFAFAWRTWVYYGPGLPEVAEHWLPGTIDVFALGLAVAAIHAAWTLGEPLPRLAALAAEHPNWCAIAAVGCYLAVPAFTDVSIGIGFSTGKDAYLRDAFQALCALLLLLPVAFGDQSRGLYRHVVQWRPIAYIGLVSYGVYLWHDAWIVHLIDWTGGRVAIDASFWPVLLGAFALSIVCGAISYRTVERPLLELDARLTRGTAVATGSGARS